MIHLIHISTSRLKTVLVLVSLAFLNFAYSQNVTGPTPVAAGSTQTYSYSSNGLLFINQSWTITGGSEISTWFTKNPYTEHVSVQWGNGTSGQVTFSANGLPPQTLNVTLTGGNTGGGTPANTNLSNQNYVHTITPLIPTTSTNSLEEGEKIESVTYYDGLGRTKQSNAIRAGGGFEDIVTHVDYDQYGRIEKEYLPYAQANNGGALLSNALSATNSFYLNKYGNDLDNSNPNPFTEKDFEASPLNRVLKQAAPGQDWAMGSDHEVETQYLTNTSIDAVKRYEVTLNYNTTHKIYDIQLDNLGNYNAGQLFKTILKDENHNNTSSDKNHTVEEYKDTEGRIILKRTYSDSDLNNNGSIGSNETQVKHDTYYVYDAHGNLTYVLPPKVNTNATITTAVLNGLCYQYKYDRRNRLVEKKVPGKGWESIVYNKLDQPVLTQDENLNAQNKWLFTKYDAFGRVAFTGVTSNSASRSSLQNSANNTNTYTQYVAKTTTPQTIANTTVYYTNSSIPHVISEIHTINYYDDYTFDKAGLTLPSSVDGQSVINYNNANGTKKLTKSLATGSKVRVLDVTPAQWITTITGYDVKGRPIIVKSNNPYLQTNDVITSTLDFTGNVITSTTTHSKTNHASITTTDDFEYDHMNRLKRQSQTIGLNTEVIVENNYDELGQLESKGVGGADSNTNRLQEINYTYNIRGWLLGINNENKNKSAITLGSGDLFGFQINYNDVASGGTALFNGNVSQTLWKSTSINTGGNAISNKYSYAYDALSRLTSAIDNTGHYNVSGITYDKNGNIMRLKRQGQRVDNTSNFGEIDNLAYTYYDDSNRLRSVHDSSGILKGFSNGITTTNEYIYDDNGNLVKDLNKDIQTGLGTNGILYNYLNLPTHVYIDNGDIEYIYDATGIKLKKIVSVSGSIQKTVTYAGNYIYEKPSLGGEVLKYFSQPEGFVEKNGNNYDYVYQYVDQVGNIRLNYKNVGTATNPNLQIQEENNYYPFGLKHKGYNGNVITDHPYGFGGKEEQDDGLSLGWIDITARNYDPALGRWMNIDPLAEQMRRHSPYNYAFNNPVYFVDYDGMAPDGLTGAYGESLDNASVDHYDFGSIGAIGNNKKTDPKKNKAYEDYFGEVAQAAKSYLNDTALVNAATTILDANNSLNQGILDNFNNAANYFVSLIKDFKQEPATFGIRQIARMANAVKDKTETSVTNFVGSGHTDIALYNMERASNMSVNDWAYSFGYAAPDIAFGLTGSWASTLNFTLRPSSVLFSARKGYGLFGKSGLNIGGYKIEALYSNPGANGGTFFSVKQFKQGGNLFRLDYGPLHSTGRMSIHATYRFNTRFGKFGSSKTQFPIIEFYD